MHSINKLIFYSKGSQHPGNEKNPQNKDSP